MTGARLGALVLATDGSEDARLARRAVADLAAADAAVVHVVGAWNLAGPTYAPAYVVASDTVSELEDAARSVVEDERRALADAGVRTTAAHVLFGRPADVILDVANRVGADLIVLGSRGHGLVARLVLGSVSEEVVAAGRRPVLVMRGGDAAWPPPRIVAGFDGSREALAAARIAAAIGRCTGCDLTLLDVAQGGPEGDGDPRRLTFGDAIEGRRGRMERYARRLAERGGPAARASVTAGDPAAALLAAAGDEPAGLVAVGRRGIGRIRHALLGSVSIKVLHAAHGPVLVVPWTPVRPG
jgi:nucleotide-binding universal stress UspA family protein